jgi:hypothetical protein
MKAYLLQVLVIDHDHLGADEVERVLEDANYPNNCIAPNVIKSQTAEIGDWDDDNPLNHSDTQAVEVDRLFNTKVLTEEEVVKIIKDIRHKPFNDFLCINDCVDTSTCS